MNPRSRRGDRRRWRSRCLTNAATLTHRGGGRHTGIIPRGAHVLRTVVIRRKPDSSANASGRHILRPKVRSPLLVRHSEGSCHRSRRIPSAALREGGGGLPGNVEGLGLREPEKVDPARQDRRTLRFRKEDIDRYIASQTVAPLNTKDIRSPISLREKMREPRSLCCFLRGSSPVIVSRSATLMTFPPVWVSPFASQGRAVHTCEPEISQSVRFYEKRGFGEKPKYRRYELALLRQGFGGHPSRMACHPKLRSLGFAVATSSEGWCRRGDSTDEAPAFSPSPSRPAPRVSPPPPQAEPAL